MNQLGKSLFVTAFLLQVFAVLAIAGGYWWAGYGARAVPLEMTAWSGVILGVLPMAVFFARLFLARDVARTSANLPSELAIAAFGAALAALGAVVDVWLPLALALLHLCALCAYVFWYSRFTDRASSALQVGDCLPPFQVQDLDGQTVESATLFADTTYALLLFYRGNWCPLCQAQVKELAANYRDLAQRGVRVVLISPQPASHSARLANKFDAPMQFLVDADNAAARALSIVAENGLPATLQVLGYDSDTVMPTVVITDSGGKIVYLDLTDNYRVRPEPDVFLQVVDQLSRA